MSKISVCVVGSLLIAAAGQSASAALFQWDWTRGDPGTSGLNDNGGTFESIHSTFDSASKVLTWELTFSDQVTQGFTLALNNGPNPKGHPGELVLLYADFRNAGDIRLSAYGYNGQNSINSWRDGDGVTPNDQPADMIKGINDSASWMLSASKTDGMDGSRTLTFEIDATDLINHTPMHPDPNGDPWFGIGYAQKLGLWLHPFRTFAPTYGGAGQITGIQTGSQGWFDGSNFDTVPTPGAAVLMGLSGVLTLRRRR